MRNGLAPRPRSRPSPASLSPAFPALPIDRRPAETGCTKEDLRRQECRWRRASSLKALVLESGSADQAANLNRLALGDSTSQAPCRDPG
jgi:hypothetical protein